MFRYKYHLILLLLILKKLRFEKYLQTGKLTKEENEFCEKIDWHPVDELPVKEEYIQKLKKAKKEKAIKVKSISEIFK